MQRNNDAALWFVTFVAAVLIAWLLLGFTGDSSTYPTSRPTRTPHVTGPVPSVTMAPPALFTPGDMDCDGSTDIVDALIIIKIDANQYAFHGCPIE